MGRSFKTPFAALFLGAATILSQSNAAQEPPRTPQISAHPQAQRFAAGIYLAYVRTASPSLNSVIENGLLNLAIEAGRRSTIEIAGVTGVDLERDDLSFFPKLYWQINANTPPLSTKAQENLQKFVKSGRLLVIDMQPVQTAPGQPSFLRRILGNVQLLEQNKPLRIVEGGHSLTHSFYMLEGLPGTRNDTHTLSNGTARDAATVIIGQNRNWAQAWAGVSLQPDPNADDPGTTPYEQAMRAGLNMIASALNGTMKDDAVHQETLRVKRELRKQEAEKKRGP
jgi:hypothetical protein